MQGCRQFFFNIIAIILLLGMLEGISRFILHRVYNRKFDSSLIQYNTYGKTDALKPNATGTVWGKEFNTDQFGCRKGPKPFDAKKKKWLFIGDSVTEGVGVDDSSTFSSLVAAEIDSVNVMNYSLIGYSVTDYYQVLDSLLKQSNSGISRLTIFFCLNDVYGTMKGDQLPLIGRPTFWGKVNGVLQEKYATYKLLKLVYFKNANRYFQYDSHFYTADNYLFKKTMVELRKCKDLCIQNNIPMDVVILPYRSQVSGKDKAVPQSIVAEYCRNHGIPVADPLENLKKVKEPADLYLFADEIHFSEAGHKAISRFILSH